MRANELSKRADVVDRAESGRDMLNRWASKTADVDTEPSTGEPVGIMVALHTYHDSERRAYRSEIRRVMYLNQGGLRIMRYPAGNTRYPVLTLASEPTNRYSAKRLRALNAEVVASLPEIAKTNAIVAQLLEEVARF